MTFCNNNNHWGDEGGSRVPGVTRGDGTEGGEEGKGEEGEERRRGRRRKLLRTGSKAL